MSYKNQTIKQQKFFVQHRSRIILIFMILAKSDQPVKGKDLAHQLNIPKKTFDNLATFLHQNPLIEATRGSNGGFRLLESPENITLLDMLGFTYVPYEDNNGIDNIMRIIKARYSEISLRFILDHE